MDLTSVTTIAIRLSFAPTAFAHCDPWRSSMTHRLIALFAVCVFGLGCPAEGPIEPGSDTGSNNEEDMGPEDDGSAGEEGLELTSLEPVEGPQEGGTQVSLTGANFAEGMTVRFGSSQPVEVNVSSATSATVTTPAASAPGSVTVVVRNADGESDSLLNAFRYLGDGETSGISWCMLQAQSPVAATTGAASDGIYAVVFAEGITQGGGQGAGIEGELGWGADTDYESFDFVTMTYNVDKDGLNPGDLANDEYGAPLTIPTAGTYRYVARFRLDGGDWTYCDLTGPDDGVTGDQLGTIEVTDPAVATIGFCRTETMFAQAGPNQQSPTLVGSVFVAGSTPGAGAGAGIMGELLYGPADQPESSWTSTVTANYAADGDGLNPGDLANDVWNATLTLPMAGEYGFAFRFSVDGGVTWTSCDVDGRADGEAFTANGAGVVGVSNSTVDFVDFCHVWQDSLDLALSDNPPLITVEVFDDPITVGNAGASSGEFTVEAGYGADTANPAVPGAYTWIALGYKDLRPGVPNNYEYEGVLYPTGAKPPAGSYRAFVRVKHDTHTVWTYCDTDDADPQVRLSAGTPFNLSP